MVWRRISGVIGTTASILSGLLTLAKWFSDFFGIIELPGKLGEAVRIASQAPILIIAILAMIGGGCFAFLIYDTLKEHQTKLPGENRAFPPKKQANTFIASKESEPSQADTQNPYAIDIVVSQTPTVRVLEDDRVISTISVSVKNIGSGTLYNCMLKVTKMLPKPFFLPQKLIAESFTLVNNGDYKTIDFLTYYMGWKKVLMSLPPTGTADYDNSFDYMDYIITLEATSDQARSKEITLRLIPDQSIGMRVERLGE